MAKFEPGQLIHHRRYDYRGVIIKVDKKCKAPDVWYLRNQTQPARGQPWYHVLVDRGQETYVAEENIELDGHEEMVQHPLVDPIFPVFLNGRYYLHCPN
ncbi:MAG: heat shock protein HspQ [Candidatus Hydrogenedentota bacterium]